MLKLLFNKASHLMVSKEKDTLNVYVNYLDTFTERTARVIVGVKNFEIRAAEVEECRNTRSPIRPPACLKRLEGLILYVGSAPKIKEALAEEKAGDWEEIFLEILRSVIQCEYLLIKERGFSSEEDYEYHFHKNFFNTCIYFSRKPRKTREWFEYASKQNREKSLFTRYRYTKLCKQLDQGLLILNSTMNDSFHEIDTELVLLPDGKVMKSRAEIIRYPHKVCPVGILSIEKLIDENILQSRKGDLARKVGGQFGCSHLVDIIFDARNVLHEVQEDLN